MLSIKLYISTALLLNCLEGYKMYPILGILLICDSPANFSKLLLISPAAPPRLAALKTIP